MLDFRNLGHRIQKEKHQPRNRDDFFRQRSVRRILPVLEWRGVKVKGFLKLKAFSLPVHCIIYQGINHEA